MKIKIAPDKWRHFYAGIPLGMACEALASWIMGGPGFHAALIAFVVVVAVSYGFELFSKITGLGIYDFLDAIASVIGGVIGIALVMLFLAWISGRAINV